MPIGRPRSIATLISWLNRGHAGRVRPGRGDLTSALVAADLTTARALTAVLAYRLINFWLILFAGGIAVVVLTHARESRIRHYNRAEPQPGPPGGNDTGTCHERTLPARRAGRRRRCRGRCGWTRRRGPGPRASTTGG